MRYFIFLLFILIPCSPVLANCPVTLVVEDKQANIIAGKYPDSIPETHTVVLKPSASIKEIDECKSYLSAKEFHMHAVEQHDKVFQELAPGDIITGTLNFHLPSPYGKTLFESYHHGFRLITYKEQDFSEEYVYFRHIGVFE